MLHFYDAQIRRYLLQLIRMLSYLTYKDGDGELIQVPVMYGDPSRSAAFILKDGSENVVQSVPKIALYITNLEIDRERTSDSTFVSKVQIRERAFDEENQEYMHKEGRNYTVERLMPTPYKLSVNADIWSSNTDQKLQLMEQILMLFNPSLEIQTTDNYIDWTSLTVVDLESVQFSSRSVGGGSTETEIDVATLGFTTPIFISPPAKVKRLNVIHTIITSIFNEQYGAVDRGETMPEMLAYASNRAYLSDTKTRPVINEDGTVGMQNDGLRASRQDPNTVSWATTYKNYGLLVLNDKLTFIDTDDVGLRPWREYIKAHPKADCFEPHLTQVKLYRSDIEAEISGYVHINPDNEYEMLVDWDMDTLPSDTVLGGPLGDKTKIDYIIDPFKVDVTKLNRVGMRILILNEDIGNKDNEDGPDAWKNYDGSDFVASANDIIEWDGQRWWIVFDADLHYNDEAVYTTNLNTGIQYKYDGTEWLLSYEGEYPHGTWRLAF